VPDAIGHILIASIVATPAAITVSALMVPGEMPASRAPCPSARRERHGRGHAERSKGSGPIQIVAMLIVRSPWLPANAPLGSAQVAGALTLQRMLG
jgi:hypothetical protein